MEQVIQTKASEFIKYWSNQNADKMLSMMTSNLKTEAVKEYLAENFKKGYPLGIIKEFQIDFSIDKTRCFYISEISVKNLVYPKECRAWGIIFFTRQNLADWVIDNFRLFYKAPEIQQSKDFNKKLRLYTKARKIVEFFVTNNPDKLLQEMEGAEIRSSEIREEMKKYQPLFTDILFPGFPSKDGPNDYSMKVYLMLRDKTTGVINKIYDKNTLLLKFKVIDKRWRLTDYQFMNENISKIISKLDNLIKLAEENTQYFKNGNVFPLFYYSSQNAELYRHCENKVFELAYFLKNNSFPIKITNYEKTNLLCSNDRAISFFQCKVVNLENVEQEIIIKYDYEFDGTDWRILDIQCLRP